MDSPTIGIEETTVLEDTIRDIIDLPQSSVKVLTTGTAVRLRARRLLLNELEILFSVRAVVAAGNDPMAVYESTKSVLETSITDGSFTSTMQLHATDLGVASLLEASVSEISVDEPTVTIITPTPAPTVAPTSEPEHNSRDDNGAAALEGDMLIVIIAVCVAVSILAVVGSVLYIRSRRDPQRKKTQVCFLETRSQV